MEIPFIIEARDLAGDDHFVLTQQLEYMRDHAFDFPARDRQEWIEENEYCEDREEFFQRHRDHYLEEARKLFAEYVA